MLPAPVTISHHSDQPQQAMVGARIEKMKYGRDTGSNQHDVRQDANLHLSKMIYDTAKKLRISFRYIVRNLKLLTRDYKLNISDRKLLKIKNPIFYNYHF